MEKSNTLKHGELEFSVMLDDATINEYKDEVLALIDKFGKSGQSGE